jgi:hypothetical protein
MNPEPLQAKILDAIEKLAHAMNEQRTAATEFAHADHAYRLAQSVEYVKVSAIKQEKGKLTDPHKKALVDGACEKQMLRQRLADAEKESAILLVRTLMTQISALQSLLNANKAEWNAVTHNQTAGA